MHSFVELVPSPTFPAKDTETTTVVFIFFGYFNRQTDHRLKLNMNNSYS